MGNSRLAARAVIGPLEGGDMYPSWVSFNPLRRGMGDRIVVYIRSTIFLIVNSVAVKGLLAALQGWEVASTGN